MSDLNKQIAELKAIVANRFASDQLEWYSTPSEPRIIGIDWEGALFIIDPESPAFPCIEQALAFDGDTNVIYEEEQE